MVRDVAGQDQDACGMQRGLVAAQDERRHMAEAVAQGQAGSWGQCHALRG
jgi:hypothetical protein